MAPLSASRWSVTLYKSSSSFPPIIQRCWMANRDTALTDGCLGWCPFLLHPLTLSLFKARRVRGGWGRGGEVQFQSSGFTLRSLREEGRVREGGDCGNRTRIKSREGILWFSVITPKCIFLFLVIPASVCPADGLILCLLLNYSGKGEDSRTGTAEMIGGFTQYTTRNVIKNSQLIGFSHGKAKSSHT